MARLERNGFVEGQYDVPVAEGQLLRERHYRMLGAGQRALDEARCYFLGMLGVVSA